MSSLTIEQLPQEIVELAATPDGMERVRAAILEVFSEEARLKTTRERFQALARNQAEAEAALFAKWAEEDATDDPDELRRRDEETRELRRSMNETRKRNGERLHFPELENAA